MLVLVLLGVLFAYDLSLALVAWAFIPALLVGMWPCTTRPPERRSREAMEEEAQLQAHLFEDVSGAATVKAFGAHRARAEGGESRLVRFVQANFGLQLLAVSTSSLGMLVTGLAGIAVLWFGGHRVMSGALTIGQLLFFYHAAGLHAGAAGTAVARQSPLQDALVAVDRLFQVLTLEAEQEAGREEGGLRRGRGNKSSCARSRSATVSDHRCWKRST